MAIMKIMTKKKEENNERWRNIITILMAIQ